MSSHVAPMTMMGARGPKSKFTDQACPNEDLRYGQVIKHHRNGRLVEVERKQVFGEDNRTNISTSGVERCNLTSRQRNSRLTRKTLGFSKKRSLLGEHMTLYFAHYNLCRPHGSLEHPDERGIKRKWTPLWELRITDRNWGLEELLTGPYNRTSL